MEQNSLSSFDGGEELIKLRDMQKKYPYIEWVEYMNSLLPEPLSVNENETIAVKVPAYLENLGKLLNDTPKRVIANYIMWRITQYSSSFLTKELRRLKFEFRKVDNGRKKQQELWKTCIDLVGNE